MKLYFNQVSSSVLDVKADKRNECFNFGADNAFPSLVEVIVEMSVTSKTCVDRVSKAIYGKSFGEAGKVIVNSKGQTLNEVLRIAARDYAKHNNFYLQVIYDANLDIKAIVVIPVTDVRIGKADDKGYSGKFLIYDNWDKSKGTRIKASEFEVVDKYNPDKKVIEKQIRSAAKNNKVKDWKEAKIEDIISDYNGQIIHVRKDQSYKYSKTDLIPALKDALTEANAQTFRSNGAAKGFLNTKLLVVQPFKDEDARKEFKKDLNGLRGAENSSDVLLLEISQMTDDLDKAIKLDDLSGEYNDKLFEYSDKQAEKNICKAFSVPLMLVSQTDNSLFGSSGEMLKEAKVQLWESREEDRDQFEEVFNSIMKLFQDKKKTEETLSIANPYINEEDEKENRSINKQAQAQLRGTSAGVQGIIELARAVKEDNLDKENAVAIVRNIYGFTIKQAQQMIGGFDGQEEENKV